MPRITFQPSGKTVDVDPGTNLADACRRAGFRVSTPCGGKGLCGKCRVQILAGTVDIDAAQRACLPPQYLADGWRASCIINEYGDLTLADPEEAAGAVILTDFIGHEAGQGSGLWRFPAVLPKPSREDQRNDCDRLADVFARAGAGEPKIPLPLLARLPGLMRQSAFEFEAVGVDNRLLAVRAVGDTAPLLGLAVDVGTTTLAAALCDLETAAVLAVASRANPQAIRGDDVISRVDHAGRGPGEAEEMRVLVVDAIRELGDEALSRAGLAGGDILLVAVGGNTVMNHLLLGVDPKPLALSPFIPCFRSVQPFSAESIGWPRDAAPLVLVVPNIAAYVGGDITAGIIAHDVAEAEGNVLFIDIGTNGEIVLTAGGETYACAAAAGPAFEGARIRQGMRAAAGAVSRVEAAADGDLDIGVVDGVRPARGICGTGLLDAVATLLRLGAIDSGGRLLDADEAEEEGVNAKIAARLHEDDDGPAIWLERPESGAGGVALTQRDVRELQLAKGAIAAGVKVLLGVAGIRAEDVDSVLLAGGFGNYLSPASALGVGILPEGIALEKIRSVGNASLAGTRLYLLSDAERVRADAISSRVRYVELSGRDDFQSAFAEEMLFPEP